MSPLLRRIDASEVERRTAPPDPSVTEEAVRIVEDVRERGEAALRYHAERLGDLEPGAPLVWEKDRLEAAHASLDPETRDLLERVHGRVAAFATAQREGLADLAVAVEGGRADVRWLPVGSVGAYAPGGRYPLPSSVLMTVTPARVAGVGSVWLATPRPTAITVAAAHIAGAEGLVAAGGAQAVAALAFGTATPPVDMVVGPGNRWVTSAKRYLFGEVGIDGLAGPSEILVIADDTADPLLVAADLLAQAEHDIDAIPALIATSEEMVEEVERQLSAQLVDLPTAGTAGRALANGYAVLVDGLDEAAALTDLVAPEHLAVHVSDPDVFGEVVTNFGSMFAGSSAAEAFADYGAGPNHVLPTSGSARFSAGLSVLTFLRATTSLSIEDPSELIEDTVHLARLEGLEAHARAALARS